MEIDAKKEWETYVESERHRVTSLLTKIGITLDEEQPQTIGERYLTRPVGSGRKVVFFGKHQPDGERVVIKTSDPHHEPQGVAELAHERNVHTMLQKIHFIYGAFALPRILHFDERDGVLVTEYIAQDKPFIKRTTADQFAIALDAFKSQESAHAVTAGHWKELRKLMGAHAYRIKPGEYRKISQYASDLTAIKMYDEKLYAELDPLIDRTLELVRNDETTLERYDGFLTHWDFMPQNFRIRDGKLYLLDLTSIRFGNKYEGWARFINFMELYNPGLARALVAYVRLNRSDEELVALKVMRAYRLIELIRYYSTWLNKTKGDTRELAQVRIAFWTDVLKHVLDDTEIPSETIEVYKTKRDSLRSEDEKKRQQGLH